MLELPLPALPVSLRGLPSFSKISSLSENGYQTDIVLFLSYML